MARIHNASLCFSLLPKPVPFFFLSFQDLPRVKTLSSSVLPRGVYSSCLGLSLSLSPSCLRSRAGLPAGMHNKTVVHIHLRELLHDLTLVMRRLRLSDAFQMRAQYSSLGFRSKGDIIERLTTQSMLLGARVIEIGN